MRKWDHARMMVCSFLTGVPISTTCNFIIKDDLYSVRGCMGDNKALGRTRPSTVRGGSVHWPLEMRTWISSTCLWNEKVKLGDTSRSNVWMLWPCHQCSGRQTLLCLRVWQEDCMVSGKSSSPKGSRSQPRVPGLAVVWREERDEAGGRRGLGGPWEPLARSAPEGVTSYLLQLLDHPWGGREGSPRRPLRQPESRPPHLHWENPPGGQGCSWVPSGK